MPVSIESKRSHLHFKPHQIWQVTAYSTFIAALFSISELGYSHDLKICWSSSVLSPALTFVLASVLVLPNVLTSVLAPAIASVVTGQCSYNAHLMFISYSSSVHLITDWSLARPDDYMHHQAEAWSATATKWTNKAKTWLSSSICDMS